MQMLFYCKDLMRQLNNALRFKSVHPTRLYWASFKNRFNRLHPVIILMRCEHNLYFVWDHFKYIGDSQFLEIVTTSKEIMSFYDHVVVVFRFGRSRNE